MQGILTELYAGIAVAVFSYLGLLARTWLKTRLKVLEGVLDAQAVAGIEAAIDNAIAEAVRQGSAAKLPDVIDYLKTFNPGQLARFGLDGEELARRLAAGMARRGLGT